MRSRLVDLGSNRWGFEPELGRSSTRGRWILEAAIGLWLFTGNTELLGDAEPDGGSNAVGGSPPVHSRSLSAAAS